MEENKPEEKKEEKKETKKESKAKKPKKEKKVIVPFDKIDITTATDDDIIRSGLKHNTKTDVTCYMILAIIFVAAILPVALRIIVPRPVTKKEKEIVYYYLDCLKTLVRDNYELTTTLKSTYRDGSVQTVEMEFKYFKRTENAKDGYVFAEIEEFTSLNLKGLTVKEGVGTVSVKINYEDYPELKNHSVLKEYAYFQSTELNVLNKDKGFSCSTDSKTKKEIVDVKTGKKVE